MSTGSTATPLTDAAFDVVICGGGLAGLTLARQLRRTQPELSVAVIEPTMRPLKAGAHKVGESTVELGSLYLDSLDLRVYLLRHHIMKYGLRFFPGGGRLPVDARDEVGPPAGDAFVSSYQLDRGVFESDLRGMIEADGADLFEGLRVQGVSLAPGEAPHAVAVQRVADGATATFSARWVVDATGRRALLRRDQDLGRRTTHAGSAGWFRLSGRFDITAMCDSDTWLGRPGANARWRSTNHFMGDGYWVWVIPLPGGRTSVGIVTHPSHHAFERVRTLDNCWAFLDDREPALADALRRHLDDGEQVLDFRCMRRYSHDAARTLSPDRWAIVGEAGTFVDPLYSPGTDMIALANCHTVEAIGADQRGEDLQARTAELDDHFMALVRWGFEIFDQSAPVYGYAPAMAAKYYWDNFLYWSYHCEYFVQGIYRLSGDALAAFVPLRDGFRAVNKRMQSLLHHWSLLADDGPSGGFVTVPGLSSLSIESYLCMLTEMDPEDTQEFMALRLGQAREMLGEMTLRVLAELGPVRGRQLVQETGLADWGIELTPRRLKAADLAGKPRRRALGRVGRDLEDHIHPLRRHPDAVAAMRLAAPQARLAEARRPTPDLCGTPTAPKPSA